MATLLRQRIATRLGDDVVFQDIAGINPGDNFPEVLEAELESARFTLALFEHDWLTTSDHLGRRRIDSQADWVRRELAYSLADPDITVIPVMIGPKADFPSFAERSALPEDLQPLLGLQRTRITYDSLEHDVAPIIDQLATHFDRSTKEPHSPPVTPASQKAAVSTATSSQKAPLTETSASPKTHASQETSIALPVERAGASNRLTAYFDSRFNLFGMAGVALALLAGLIWPIGSGRLLVAVILSYLGGIALAYGSR